MPQYKLCYFNSRGFGEVSRWIFAVAGQEYEDVRFESADWPNHKPDSPTGQAPWLEVDGEKIGQSTAIARYLARTFGLAGKTPIDEAKVDMVAACADDFMQLFMTIFYESDEERKAALKKKIEEEKAPEFLQRFENLLKKNNGGDGYFVGDDITWCDMQITLGLAVMTYFEMKELCLDKYPKLKVLVDRVHAHPKIAEWIAKRPETKY